MLLRSVESSRKAARRYGYARVSAYVAKLRRHRERESIAALVEAGDAHAEVPVGRGKPRPRGLAVRCGVGSGMSGAWQKASQAS